MYQYVSSVAKQDYVGQFDLLIKPFIILGGPASFTLQHNAEQCRFFIYMSSTWIIEYLSFNTKSCNHHIHI